MHKNATTGRYAQASPSSGQHGFSSGMVQGLVRADGTPNTLGNMFGLLFNQSRADLTLGQGSAYAFGVHDNQLKLVLYTNGLSTQNILASNTVALQGARTIGLRATWIADLARYNGIRCVVEYKLDPANVLRRFDFTGMTTGIVTTITVTPLLLSSVSEGPFIRGGSPTHTLDILFDDLRAEPRMSGDL